jgi:hypothetical protein
MNLGTWIKTLPAEAFDSPIALHFAGEEVLVAAR